MSNDVRLLSDGDWRESDSEPVEEKPRQVFQHDEPSLVRQFHSRTAHQSNDFSVARLPHRPPDKVGWFGAKRESAEVQEYNARVDAIADAYDLADLGLRLGLRLEVVGVREAARALLAVLEVLRGLRPDSLEATLTREFVFDALERIRQLGGIASENFRRKAFD